MEEDCDYDHEWNDESLDEAAAAGVSFALLIARDEVSSANPHTSDQLPRGYCFDTFCYIKTSMNELC